MKWPKVPRIIEGMAGPVRVRFVRRVRVKGESCWGSWQAEKRLITLDASAPREHQWMTFFHEYTHSGLADSGIEMQVSDAGIEAICQTAASMQMRLMRARLAAGHAL
jgi:hypothetical protein